MLASILMQTPVSPIKLVPSPEELLRYLSLYRVVVCTFCRYAIQPNAIERHLKELHRLNRSDRQPYMRYIEKFELAENKVVMQYAPGDFPVPLLPVQNGLQCRFEDCTYLCVTEKRMKHHWLSVHERQGLAACDWRPTLLQTFFKGNLLRYFTGIPSEKSDERTIAQATHQDGTEGSTVCSSQSKLNGALLISL